MNRRNLALVVASIACFALAGCASVGGPSGASCVTPMSEVESPRAAPGGEFLVRGEAFAEGCDDTGPVIEPSEPLREVRIVFGQGLRRWELATVDADRRLSFEARVRVPKGAGPGRGVVRAAWPMSDPFLRPQDRMRVLDN